MPERVRSPEAKAKRAAAEKARRATKATLGHEDGPRPSRTNGEPTGPTPPVEHQFKPGNPGRPKGSRNKLGEAFVAALHDDFQEHGVAVIQAVRVADPAAYVRVIAGLLPKELKIETVSDLTDEQLDTRIRQLTAALADETGIAGPAGGGGEASEAFEAAPLPAVH